MKTACADPTPRHKDFARDRRKRSSISRARHEKHAGLRLHGTHWTRRIFSVPLALGRHGRKMAVDWERISGSGEDFVKIRCVDRSPAADRCVNCSGRSDRQTAGFTAISVTAPNKRLKYRGGMQCVNITCCCHVIMSLMLKRKFTHH